MHQTHLFPSKNGSRLLCLLDMSAEDPSNVSARVPFGFNSGHVISDLHLAGGAADGWEVAQGWPADRHADYGIYGQNEISTLYQRVLVSWVKRAGYFGSYCFYNRFEDCS